MGKIGRYELVVLATQRAKQLNRGAKPKVESRYGKPTSVALEELLEDKIGFHNVSSKGPSKKEKKEEGKKKEEKEGKEEKAAEK